MSISTDVHLPYVCGPLGPYISPVNDSINPITLIGLPYHIFFSDFFYDDSAPESASFYAEKDRAISSILP